MSATSEKRLFDEIETIADRARWDHDTVIHHLVTFIAQSGDHAKSLVTYLQNEEDKQADEDENDGEISNRDYAHRYAVLICPLCFNDLTKPGGVTIETFDEINHFYPSRLDETGKVLDVNDVIRQGLHSDTLCGQCTEPLNEHEIF